ncbi:MAG TPA: PAS domain S-box protein, partial [Candidatus Thermoplasmatota archaeon]|nr:PAS domain S-box protein [Candidatus Thermoplasmatota archaeon]
LRRIREEDLQALALDERHLDSLRRLAPTSAMIVPLTAGGRVIGTFTLVTLQEGVQYDEADLDLAANLASRLALAIENARLLAALQQNESRYRTLYEDSPSVFLTIGIDGTIRSANRYGAYYLGFLPEELVGRPAWELYHPEDRDYARDRHLRALTELPLGGVTEWEARKVRKDGAVLWVREIVSITSRGPEGPVALVNCVDITERHTAVNALKASEERYRSLVETAPDIVYSVDLEGRYTALNPAWEKILGWPVEDWLGRSFVEVVHPHDLPPTMDLFQSVLRGEEPDLLVIRLRTPDGSYKPLEVLARPRVQGGRVVAVFGVGRDITRRSATPQGQA